MAADPAEADLHLVGDADAAGLPNHAVDFLEVAVRQKHLACDARNGFGEEETRRFASGAHRRDQLGHVFGEALAVFLQRPGGRRVVTVRNGRHVNMRLLALSALAAEFVCAEIDQLLRRAVIGQSKTTAFSQPVWARIRRRARLLASEPLLAKAATASSFGIVAVSRSA